MSPTRTNGLSGCTPTRTRYGTKAEQYQQLIDRLQAHRDIPILVAHMGGTRSIWTSWALCSTSIPNMYVDTSATRWIVRELGRQPEAARAFFARYKERILFGTDQVAMKDPEPFRYTSALLDSPAVLGDRRGLPAAYRRRGCRGGAAAARHRPARRRVAVDLLPQRRRVFGIELKEPAAEQQEKK